MTVQWGFIFLLFAVLMALSLALLFMPLAVRRILIRALKAVHANPVVKALDVIVAGLLLLLLWETYNEYAKYTALAVPSALGELGGQYQAALARVFRAQRNGYLCVSTLYLMAVVWKLANILPIERERPQATMTTPSLHDEHKDLPLAEPPQEEAQPVPSAPTAAVLMAGTSHPRVARSSKVE